MAGRASSVNEACLVGQWGTPRLQIPCASSGNPKHRFWRGIVSILATKHTENVLSLHRASKSVFVTCWMSTAVRFKALFRVWGIKVPADAKNTAKTPASQKNLYNSCSHTESFFYSHRNHGKHRKNKKCCPIFPVACSLGAGVRSDLKSDRMGYRDL